ncbi:MAG: DUF1579 domain-containing protein, partial [bacterium]|nr:DUF1579 domain-containing protein [bacterium]
DEGKAVRTMILGGRVLEERFSGPGMGGPPFEGLGHTGYDNITGRYWSTWIDNMMTGVAFSYGSRDDAGKTWLFEGEAPDPMAGQLIPMRIEGHTDEDGREISEFYRPGPDGQMFKSMELVYERQ